METPLVEGLGPLAENESLYRDVFERARVPNLLVEAGSGRVVQANPAACAFFGHPRAALVGMGIWDLDGLGEVEALRRLAAARAAGQAELDVQYRLASGERCDAHVHLSLVEAGGRALLHAVISDLTARKRSLEALRTTTLLLEQCFEQSPIPMVLVTMPDMVLRIVNPASRRFLGIEDEPSLVGTSLLAIRPSWQDLDAQGRPGSVEDLPLARSLAGRRTEGEERRIIRKDGTVRHELVSASPVFDDAGRVIAGYLIMADITERKQAEAALQLTRISVEAASDAMFWMTPDARIVDVNEAACRLLGYAREDLLGLSVPDVDAQFNAARWPDHFAELRRLGTLTFESEQRHRDGRLIPVEIVANYVKFGNEERNCAFVRDLTTRKQAEAAKARLEGQLQQAQKMESVGRLAGGIAHDFNNMLGVILGHTATALEGAAPGSPLHADMAEIEAAAKRSADLTRQLLAFARKQTIQPVVLDLNPKVAALLRMLQRVLGEDIRLTWRPDAGLWLTKVDPSQLHQVLTNLCVNARDAIAGVGQLTIETGNATVDEVYCAAHPEATPGEFVTLTVSDTGSGMDPETQSHLFEPFFTTKAIGKGSGLGLATVYGIVKQSDGFINVYSEPGAGTTFTVYLPRHLAQARGEADATADEPIPRGHETVLLVEDEQGLLKVTRRLLERQGYTVLAAATPGEALRLAGEHRDELHLLLTDVVMPEMNGPDLARRLGAQNPKLKLLFMSGYTANIIDQHGVLGEGVHFIQKPFSERNLSVAVRAALDG